MVSVIRRSQSYQSSFSSASPAIFQLILHIEALATGGHMAKETRGYHQSIRFTWRGGDPTFQPKFGAAALG
jgi:hypothetical protein